jgi:hypothetical protein
MVAGFCLPCAAGQYSNAGWNACAACEPGKYATSPASSACTNCAAGTHAAEFGSVLCNACPASSLCTAAQLVPAIALFYQHKTLLGPWLHLLFSVQCGSRLQPFVSRDSECRFSETVATETLCPQHGSVVILVHATDAADTRMIFYKDGSLHKVLFPHRDCIYMELGVMWIDAAVHTHTPRDREIDVLLRHSQQSAAESGSQGLESQGLESQGSESQALESQALQGSELLPAPTLPPPGTCRRERHVLTLTP